MRIVVISATSQIARSCISAWAERGDQNFVLVGRDQNRLLAIASDLAIRFPGSKFEIDSVDFDGVESIVSLVGRVGSEPIDQVLIAQGSLTDQERASLDFDYLKEQLELNAISAAIFLEVFASFFERQGFGNLAVIGSVASDRGRAYNYSYGAAKALLDVYVQGLWQRFGDSKISVSLIQPGPTATPMTANHRGPMASPELVGKVIVAGLARRRRRIYAPRIWRLVMLVVKLIPFGIFKRLTF